MTLAPNARHRLPPSDPSRARDGDTASAIERTITEQRAGVRCPILAGKWLTSIDSYTGKDTEILTNSGNRDHKLGRQPIGWVVCDIDQADYIYRLSWDAQKIWLICPASGGAAPDIHYKVWVF